MSDIDEQIIAGRTRHWFEINSSSVKNQLIVKPLNREKYKGLLSDSVYKSVGDFALALYRFIICNDTILLTSKITYDDLRRWHLEENLNTLFHKALENSAKLFPPHIIDLRTGCEEMLFDRRGTYDSKEILLSAQVDFNGAASLFYPGVMNEMMKVMAGPFIAIFLGTSYIRIHRPDDFSYMLTHAVVHDSKLFDDFLSGKIYYCDHTGISVVNCNTYKNEGDTWQ